MIAYFALLSFVPLLFLALALLGTTNDDDSHSFFVRELHRTFPSTSLDSILTTVRAIQHNLLLRSGTSARRSFSGRRCRCSACSRKRRSNIVYDRPNRPFLRGKALASAMMIVSLAFLFSSLVIGTIGVELLKRYTGLSDNVVVAYVLTVTVSLVGVFVFLTSAYVVLTNLRLSWREVVPGAAFAAAVLEATFQFLPLFVRISKHNPVLQALSGPVVLLVWLYVMSNVIVLGAEVNLHLRSRMVSAETGDRSFEGLGGSGAV